MNLKIFGYPPPWFLVDLIFSFLSFTCTNKMNSQDQKLQGSARKCIRKQILCHSIHTVHSIALSLKYVHYAGYYTIHSNPFFSLSIA